MNKEPKFNFTEDWGHLQEEVKEKIKQDLLKSWIELTHWLWKNHRGILREYEKDVLKTKLRIEFA